jgi:MoaA/NifB/PqqE/SkfB family radical SAM enzyme
MNKTWCIHPFTQLATITDGRIVPCCIAKPYKNVNLNDMTVKEIWNHSDILSLRQKLLNGEEVDNCRVCYDDELHGISTHRIQSNSNFEKLYGISEKDFTSPELDITNLVALDLRLGNTCNLKCIMCRPQESHKWFDDVVAMRKINLPPVVSADMDDKFNYNRNDYNWINKKVFWDNIDEILPNIKEFIFGGGEPFMLKEVKKLLNKAIELDTAKNLSIRFHTNGTYMHPKDFEILKHFKRIQLMFSVDGVNEINHFLRYPAQWDSIIEIIEENEKYGPNIESSMLCSLTSVSAFYLDQLYDFVDSKKWNKLPLKNLYLGRVHDPSYLNPQTLDTRRKKIIEDKFNRLMKDYPLVKSTLESNLNWILGDSGNNVTVDDTLEYVKNLCSVRNIDPNVLREFLED